MRGGRKDGSALGDIDRHLASKPPTSRCAAPAGRQIGSVSVDVLPGRGAVPDAGIRLVNECRAMKLATRRARIPAVGRQARLPGARFSRRKDPEIVVDESARAQLARNRRGRRLGNPAARALRMRAIGASAAIGEWPLRCFAFEAGRVLRSSSRCKDEVRSLAEAGDGWIVPIGLPPRRTADASHWRTPQAIGIPRETRTIWHWRLPSALRAAALCPRGRRPETPRPRANAMPG